MTTKIDGVENLDFDDGSRVIVIKVFNLVCSLKPFMNSIEMMNVLTLKCQSPTLSP